MVRLFDLGFAKPVRLMAGSTVFEVSSNSPAYRAGLRDGDVLTKSVDINPIASSFDAPIKLDLRSEAGARSVSYAPRGSAVKGMTWSPVLAPVNAACH